MACLFKGYIGISDFTIYKTAYLSEYLDSSAAPFREARDVARNKGESVTRHLGWEI